MAEFYIFYIITLLVSICLSIVCTVAYIKHFGADSHGEKQFHELEEKLELLASRPYVRPNDLRPITEQIQALQTASLSQGTVLSDMKKKVYQVETEMRYISLHSKKNPSSTSDAKGEKTMMIL